MYFNKVDRSDPSNYRHISLTCVACEIMVSVIKDVEISHLLENNLLNNCQVGFVGGGSFQLQLLSLLNNWTDILVSGHSIDVVYLNFKKAFDSSAFYPNYIPMGFMILFKAGHSLLSDVKDFVYMPNVTSGIPQRSFLGSVFFIFSINNRPGTVVSNVYMFADDTKIYCPMTSHELK